MRGAAPGVPAAALGSPRPPQGFILVFSLLMLMGVSAVAVGMVYNAHQAQVNAQNHKNRLKAFYAADGIRALLAQEVLDGNAYVYIDSSKIGEIDGHVWDGLSGGLPALEAALGSSPSRRVFSGYLGSNWKFKSYYGVRWRGYLTPPSTGMYTFFIRADDQGAFYLSKDDKPANLSPEPVALLETPTLPWPKPGEEGISQPVPLKMGQRYYFEFLHAQSDGRGLGQVGWRGPNHLVERPISGKRLALYGTKSEKWDTTRVDKVRVKYALAEAGPLVFTLNTESFLGGAGDSVFHSPLNQTLSLRGDNPAPPESLWQRVIFYDFRSDRSNPDFDRGFPDFGGGVVTTGMVRDNQLRYTTENADYFGLDSIGKPILANPKWSCGVEKWFTPWRPGWTKTYLYAGGSADCAETDIAPADTAFKNAVVKDSLLFVRRADLGVNAYQFRRFTTSGSITAFSPLDGKGLGNEGNLDKMGIPRNFSFCMELHTQFEHTSGMTFEFNGDDDVWLFINDSLVMDLGFVHSSTYANIVLDELPLKFGETYPLDFFYCERQRTGSSIDLITNLPVLQIRGKPASSWKRDYGNID